MTRRFMRAPLSILCVIILGLLAQAQQRPYRGTYQSVRQTILRLETRANLFRNSIEAWSQSDTAANVTSENVNATDEDVNLMGRDFADSAHSLRNRFTARQSTSSDVQQVLSHAARIDDFVRRNSLDAGSMNYWSSIRVDLNQLAYAYNLTWPQSTQYNPPSGNQPYNPPSGNQPYYPPSGNQYGLQRLSGTYRVDRSRSEDARVAVDRAAIGLSRSERQRVLDNISRRLDPPEELAIDLQGSTVTMASTRAPQVTFDADGRERVETTPNGGTIRLRASMSGNQLTISSTGDRGNEFTVVMQPADYGRSLNVVRRIYTPELNRSIEVRSTYNKTSNVARFDIYNPNATYPTTAYGDFVVPDGTRVVSVLDRNLSSRTASIGDRFTLRVTDPVEFQGAIIEGHVANIQRSGRLTGRSAMTMDFDRIRLSDGRSYRFAGLLESVSTTNGETVRVDTEGAIRDRSQTTTTEQRAAIGTAVGAIIGAIAGGGKGAAIGAILGAGAGAGSVYVEGQDALELYSGTEMVIRAGAPNNIPR